MPPCNFGCGMPMPMYNGMPMSGTGYQHAPQAFAYNVNDDGLPGNFGPVGYEYGMPGFGGPPMQMPGFGGPSYETVGDGDECQMRRSKPVAEIQHAESTKEFDAIISKARGSVVVDFFADWCGPCKVVAPQFQELANENPEVTFVKVNVDRVDEDPVSLGIVGFEVSSMPTFAIVDTKTKVAQRVIKGASKIQELAEIVRQVAEDIRENRA
ncbi:MAG: hypothetical protein MHM6MM_008009 [Cercozoa sp. M6MM]